MPMCVCVYVIRNVSEHSYEPASGADLPPAAAYRLVVPQCCLTLGRGWGYIKLETTMGGGAGMGLQARGRYYFIMFSSQASPYPSH
jgi:hypothetical protein